MTPAEKLCVERISRMLAKRSNRRRYLSTLICYKFGKSNYSNPVCCSYDVPEYLTKVASRLCEEFGIDSIEFYIVGFYDVQKGTLESLPKPKKILKYKKETKINE